MPEKPTSAAKSAGPTAIIGGVAGPIAAAMYETGYLDLFRAMPMLNIWLVVLLGVVGVCALIGVLYLVANGAVLGLYGFLAAFFSFGGSR